MARRTIFLGSSTSAPVDTQGPLRPSWPDIGSDGVSNDTSIGALAQAKAIALASETDWDIVRVWFGGGSSPELLIPGRVLFVPAGKTISRIAPVTPCPPTRKFPSAMIATGGVPTFPPGVKLDCDIASPGTIHNRSGGPVTLYKWSVRRSSGPGGELSGTYDGGTIIADGGVLVNVEAAAHNRPADYSLDKVWNLADLLQAGVLRRTDGSAETRVPFASENVWDLHGNPGDPTQPTTMPYPRFNAASRLADMSDRFFGRLALDVFEAFPVAEEGGHPYRPRLAPARYVTFPQSIAVAATTGAPATPDQPLVTVPTLNARSLEFSCRNDGNNDLYLLLVMPAYDDSILGVAGEPNTADAPAPQWLTLASGQEGSLILDDIRQPYAKILVGANVGGTYMGSALLTIKREVIE
jgi:hypothetical protein